MNESAKNQLCPKCGAPVPAEAAQGLCPRCVLSAAATAAETDPPPGRSPELPSLEVVAKAFPQLEIVDWVGSGGMASVFKARQPHLDRFVAVKLLSPRLARDPHFAERFNREARLLARLNHPNIVSVYDFGQSGGFYYLLMEFVDGVNLRQAMRAGRFSPAEALSIVPRICDALQFAHEEGILHRDIKPENILLDGKGRVKIADFGIAKLVGDEPGSITLTHTGATLGTPQYMAPEQLESPSSVDHRADIFSLGVVFYELLTGELPLGRFAPPSAKTPLSERVDEIVLRALAKERELRQQSAGQLKTEVETAASQAVPPTMEPPRATPPPDPRESVPLQRLRAHVPAALAAALVFPVGTMATGFFLMRGLSSAWWRFAEFAQSSAVGPLLATIAVAGLTAVLAAAVIGLVNWGDRRKNQGVDRTRLPSMPAWARRGAFLLLAVALLSVLRTAWVFCFSQNGSVMWSWDQSALLALASYTIWNRNGTARLAVTVVGVASLFLSFVALAMLWSRGPVFIMVGHQTGSGIWLGFLSSLAWIAALAMLWNRQVRESFGTGNGPEPTVGPDSAPGAGDVKWSRKAVTGVILTGISLPLPLLFTIVSLGRAGAVGPREILLALILSGAPGVAGTILSWMALEDIRSRAGRLRGLPLALAGSLAWPGLFVFWAAILIPVVTSYGRAGRVLPGVAIVVALISGLILTFGSWALLAGAGRAASRRLDQRLQWAVCLAGGLMLSLVVFISLAHSSMRMTDVSQPEQSALPAIAEAHLTFTAAEWRGDEGERRLVLSFEQEAYGDAQPIFHLSSDGQEEAVWPEPKVASSPDGIQTVPRRVEWKLPPDLTRDEEAALQKDITEQCLLKSLTVRSGERVRLFTLTRPAVVIMGSVELPEVRANP